MGRPSHELTTMAEQVTGRGARGVVAAAAPQAAVAASAVLADGGNAFDAVVAAALAESVLLPPKCGLGGDLIAIVLAAGESTPRSLIAVGGAAAGHAAVARSGTWRDVGPDSVGPPAAAAGHAALAELGRLPRARLAAPAIALARGGFAWASVCERLSEMAHDLVAEMHPDGTDYYPGGSPIRAGTVVRLNGLAAVLDEWVLRGEHLLDGPVGDALLDAVVTRGGALRRDDFEHARAEWLPCASRSIDASTVWATPAPTHGPSLLDALGRYADGPRSAAALHGAVMASIAEQRATLGDPGGTSIVSAADSDGNAAVVVHSNSYPRFGSGIIVPGYQLPLANRAGRGFTPVEGHPNLPTAGRGPAPPLPAW
ncbi:MAG: gamma-glutamyltransferase, partial [Ilumatobacteraceae bacterium]